MTYIAPLARTINAAIAATSTPPISAECVDQAQRTDNHTLARERRCYDERVLWKQTVLLDGHHLTWYGVGYFSERFGTTDHCLFFDELADAQAIYDACAFAHLY